MKSKIQTKTIKFHSAENLGKTIQIQKFLVECNNVGNLLIQLHFGSIIETNKFEFINNTKDYNNVFFQIRSHHFQQIQEKVFNTIWIRYDSIIKGTNFHDPKLNYLKHFVFHWDDVEKHLGNKKDDFHQQVFQYWITNKKEIIYFIERKILNRIKDSKFPKLKKFALKVDGRTTVLVKSHQTNHFEYWLSLITNTKVGKHYVSIDIPIKWSAYHEAKLNGLKLNNSFIIKWDNVYERLEIIGSYNQLTHEMEYNKPTPNNTLGVDVGVANLLTFSNGYQIDTEALQKEFEKFLKYEKQIKRLEAKDLYNSKKYLRKQKKLTNKVENQINRSLNDIPPEIEYVVFEDLNFKDPLSKRINYLIRRFRVQGILTKTQLTERPFKIETINPAYTSQQCWKCNFVSKENRKTQSEFRCINCGYSQDADFNAALNIRERFLDVRFKQFKFRGQIKKFLNELFEAG